MDEHDRAETIPTQGGYARESGYARRQRLRRRRMVITLLLIGLALFFAFWYALSYYSDNKDVPAPRKTCVTPKVAFPPSKIRVNVYNATSRTGLAAATSKSLASRGFVIGKVANDPLQKTIKGAAEVRNGAAGVAQARALAKHLTSVTYVRDKRKDASVDIVLGTAWKSLGPPPAAPTPTCR